MSGKLDGNEERYGFILDCPLSFICGIEREAQKTTYFSFRDTTRHIKQTVPQSTVTVNHYQAIGLTLVIDRTRYQPK